MKILFTVLLSIIYLLFAIFGLAIQSFDNTHHLAGRCLSVIINGYGCPNPTDDYGSANFHIKAFKTFSMGFVDDWGFENVKLAFFIILVFVFLVSASRFFQKFVSTALFIYNLTFLSWLSLFRLSPTLKH